MVPDSNTPSVIEPVAENDVTAHDEVPYAPTVGGEAGDTCATFLDVIDVPIALIRRTEAADIDPLVLHAIKIEWAHFGRCKQNTCAPSGDIARSNTRVLGKPVDIAVKLAPSFVETNTGELE